MDSKSEFVSEIDHRASLRAPLMPRDIATGFDGMPKRLVPAEPVFDRLWRTMGETSHCQWFDRDVEYVTFWVGLSERFGTDYRPEEDGASFSIAVKTPSRAFALKTNLKWAHMANICFVHKGVFHLRTNLPPKLLDLLKRLDAGKAPTVPLTLVLRRGSAPGRTARRFGSERTFPITRASGPIVF